MVDVLTGVEMTSRACSSPCPSRFLSFENKPGTTFVGQHAEGHWT